MKLIKKIRRLLGKEEHDYKYIEGDSWWIRKGHTHECTKCGDKVYCSRMQFRMLQIDYPKIYVKGCKGKKI